MDACRSFSHCSPIPLKRYFRCCVLVGQMQNALLEIRGSSFLFLMELSKSTAQFRQIPSGSYYYRMLVSISPFCADQPNYLSGVLPFLRLSLFRYANSSVIPMMISSWTLSPPSSMQKTLLVTKILHPPPRCRQATPTSS